MRFIYTFLFITLSSFCFTGCENFDEDCIADVAVTALTAPSAVISGNPIDIICTIRNVIETAADCTDSGEGTVTVTCSYSPTFKENFSEYEVFEESTSSIDNFKKGEGQTDPMSMPTLFGEGYYAMKVQVDYPNDSSSGNDSQAIAIRAD